MPTGDVSMTFTIPARLLPVLYLTGGSAGRQPDDASGRLRQSTPGSVKPSTAGVRPEDSPGRIPGATTGRMS